MKMWVVQSNAEGSLYKVNEDGLIEFVCRYVPETEVSGSDDCVVDFTHLYNATLRGDEAIHLPGFGYVETNLPIVNEMLIHQGMIVSRTNDRGQLFFMVFKHNQFSVY